MRRMEEAVGNADWVSRKDSVLTTMHYGQGFDYEDKEHRKND